MVSLTWLYNAIWKMHIAGTPAKINVWYSVNESWRMSTRQWKKADVVPWRGIALHDRRRTWDDTSPDTTVNTLQCGYLCVIPNMAQSEHLKAWSLRTCITLFHTWLDNSSDPSRRCCALGDGAPYLKGAGSTQERAKTWSPPVSRPINWQILNRNSEGCGLIDELDAYNSSKWPRNLAMMLAARETSTAAGLRQWQPRRSTVSSLKYKCPFGLAWTINHIITLLGVTVSVKYARLGWTKPELLVQVQLRMNTPWGASVNPELVINHTKNMSCRMSVVSDIVTP